MRDNIAVALQAVGILSLTISGFVVAPAAGFGVLGVGLVLFGLVAERGSR